MRVLFVRDGRARGGKVISLALGPSAGVSSNDDDLPKSTEGRLLSQVRSWGIGGPAKYFTGVTCSGSSLLECCCNWIDFLEGDSDGVYRVGSGYPFSLLGIRCSKEGFTGLEFACGILGTVGGAVT